MCYNTHILLYTHVYRLSFVSAPSNCLYNCIFVPIIFFLTFLSVCISVLALTMGALGETFSRTTAGYCWIKTCDYILAPRDQFIWMLFAGKLWDVISYLAIVNIIVMFLFLQKRDVSWLSWLQIFEKDLQRNTSAYLTSTTSKEALLIRLRFCSKLKSEPLA